MKHWIRNFCLLIIFLYLIFLPEFWRIFNYQFSQPSLASIPLFSLQEYHRILILAPHCDDETLSSAGVIMAAIRLGIEVRVVMETNGDGYVFATMEDFHKVYPHNTDFIKMGELRQTESSAALHVLGILDNEISFLSYPDRGTPSLWSEYWDNDKPYRSPYTGDNKSPYLNTFNKKAIYSGESLLSDLESILLDYKPDLVIYPDPEDVHPDHWGLSVFTRLAIADVKKNHVEFHPKELTYLIHRPNFPQPKGLFLQGSLVPPEEIYKIDTRWLRYDLNSVDVDQKLSAVAEYKSQLPLLSRLLYSFIRQNELFDKPISADLQTLNKGDWQNPNTWLDAQGKAIKPVQEDPINDFITRKIFIAGDLVALYLVKNDNNNLNICAQLRGKTDSDLIYTLKLHLIENGKVNRIEARNNHLKTGQQTAILIGNYACFQLKSNDLGNPWLIIVGADVEEIELGVLDQIPWQLVYVNSQ
jgi:N-acetyl-1-D-myo-inositol-2-amino-2-deoxy-alpha-D-glucopyranoside deacetylase